MYSPWVCSNFSSPYFLNIFTLGFDNLKTIVFYYYNNEYSLNPKIIKKVCFPSTLPTTPANKIIFIDIENAQSRGKKKKLTRTSSNYISVIVQRQNLHLVFRCFNNADICQLFCYITADGNHIFTVLILNFIPVSKNQYN